MATMEIIGEGITVLYTREAPSFMDAVRNAVDEIFAILDERPEDLLPTQEPINISTGFLHEWGYYGRGDDSRHRTSPRARKNRNTK